MQPTQQTIFDAIRESRRNPKPATAPKGSTQAENMDRCESKLTAAILAFFGARKPGDFYHGNDLIDFVAAQVGGDKESPKRIMRLLRKKKLINYKVEYRPESLYQVLAVERRAT